MPFPMKKDAPEEKKNPFAKKGKKPGFPFKKKKGKKGNLAAQLEGLK